MSHKHTNHSCEHAEVTFCKTCNLVYCKDCDREWKTNTWTYTYPYNQCQTSGYLQSVGNTLLNPVTTTAVDWSTTVLGGGGGTVPTYQTVPVTTTATGPGTVNTNYEAKCGHDRN